MVGDLLQDDKAGQNQAHWASQPCIGLLAAIGPVPLAILQETGPNQTTCLRVNGCVQHDSSAPCIQCSSSNYRCTPAGNLKAYRVSAVAQMEVRPEHASVLRVRPADIKFVEKMPCPPLQAYRYRSASRRELSFEDHCRYSSKCTACGSTLSVSGCCRSRMAPLP